MSTKTHNQTANWDISYMYEKHDFVLNIFMFEKFKFVETILMILTLNTNNLR